MLLIYQFMMILLSYHVVATNKEETSNFTILYDDYFQDQIDASQRQELRNVKFAPVRSDMGLQSLVAMNSQTSNVYFSFDEKITLMHHRERSLIERRIDFKDSTKSLVWGRALFFTL